MSISSVHDPNIAVSLQGRFALYIEGVRCAFSQCQLMIEDGLIPRVAISVPATPMMRDMARRVRIHLLHKEVVNDEWVVLFEGEILTRGFQKTPTSRDLTFMAYHVTAIYDQYAITALDPVAATQAAMQAADISNPTIGTVNGNIINLFTPEAIVSELKTLKGKAGIKKDDVTFADFVKGAFMRYQKLIDASRVRNAYPNEAIKAHRLIERIKTPSADLIDWDAFYTQLMGETLAGTAQAIGGRVTFYELLRTMAQYFLHQITVNPHAESYTKQVQVKPQTVFNAVPRCNVVFSSMSDSYEFSENYAEKPTRIQGQFYPPGAPASDRSAALSRYFTVYGPTELQWRWIGITKELEKLPRGGEQAAQVSVNEKTGELTAKPPKDGIPFITREETSRGIISSYYDIPRTLNTAVMHLITKITVDGSESPVDTVPESEIPARAYETIKSDDEEDRIIKYWAFLCMALGDGTGIDPKRFKTGFEGDYFKKGDRLIHMPIPSDGASAKFATLPKSVPTRITYLGVRKIADIQGDGAKRGRRVTNHKQIRATGVNYFIASDGTIIQVLPREQHLFSEPLAVPLGIRIQGLNLADAMDINARIPQFGVTQDDQAKDPQKWSSQIKGTVMAGAWPLADKPAPTTNADGLVDAIAFPASATYLSNPMTLDQYGNISIRDDDAEVKSVSMMGDVLRKVVKVIDKHQVVINGVQYYYLRFSAPCLRKGDDFVIRVVSSPDLGRDVHPFRPWVVIADKGAGPAAISKQNLESAVSTKSAITNKDQLALGNHQNVVIGFDTNDGKGLNPEQVKAAGFLTAAIKELSSRKVGTSKAPKASSAQREQQIKDEAVKQAADYFPSNEGNFFKLTSWLGAIKGETAKWQAKLFQDFTTWDNKLREGQIDPLADVTIQTETVSSAAPGWDISSAPNAKVETAVAGLADALSGVKVEINDSSMGKFIDYYAAAIINFQFYYQRYAGQSFSASTVFNPYMLVGYPALLLDDSDAKYHLLAYVHSVNHVILPNAAQTQVTYTHVRNARTEKAIPYRYPQSQYFNVQLGDMSKFDLGTEKGRKAYHQTLEKMNLKIDTALPIEMLSIGRDGKTHSEVPFVYHGGFGLGKKREQNYTLYADYCGYVGTDGKQLETKAMLDKFVFSDDPWLNYAMEGDASEGVAERADVDTVKALGRVYRPIQKVGQNNIQRRQASLIDFDSKEAIDSAFMHAIGHHGEHVPDAITMWAAPPEYKADGSVSKKGDPFKFDTHIQKKVREHTALVNNRSAVRG